MMHSYVKIILSLLLLLSFSFELAHAQNPKKTKEEIVKRNRQVKMFQDLLNKTQLDVSKNLQTKKPCTEVASHAIKSAQFSLDTSLIRMSVEHLFRSYYPKGKAFKNAKPNSFLSNADFAMSILSDLATVKYRRDSKKVLDEFIKRFSKKSKHELSKEEYAAFEYYISDVLFTGPDELFYMERIRKKATKCTLDMDCYLEMTKNQYPECEWQLMIRYKKSCDCSTKSTEKDLKWLSTYFKCTLKTVFTSKDLKIVGITNKKYIDVVTCCGEKEVEEPKGEPKPKKNKSSLPGNYSSDGKPISTYTPGPMVGGGIGLGFIDDFNEIGICARLEYLYLTKLMDEVDDFLWFIGANAEYNTILSELYDQSRIRFGPKIQLHKRLPRVGQLQLVNGFKAQYMTGKNNSNGFKSKTSGVNLNLFTGLNFPVSKKLDLGVEVPVFNFSSTTTKPDIGQESSNTDVSLLLNNENLLKILLRMQLGN